MTKAAHEQENDALNTSPKPHMPGEESRELRADGEERFRKAVRAAAKSGPKHREPKR